MANVLTDEQNYTDIANAIRSKNGIEQTYLPSEMPQAILDIPVLDTSDADATASDIVENKSAYVDGEKVVGNVAEISSDSTLIIPLSRMSGRDSNVEIVGTNSQNRLFRTDSNVEIDVPCSRFGNAISEDVVAGKYFTSSAGFYLEGTAQLADTIANLQEVSVVAQENISTGDTVYVDTNSNAYVAIDGNISLSSGNTVSIGYATSDIALGESGTVKIIASVTCS